MWNNNRGDCNNKAMLNLEHVSFGYIKQPMTLIDINLKKDAGTVFLFGQKGAGKTSLLELICGMQDLYVGKIEVLGKPVKEVTEYITYLPADVVALKNKTVIDNMKFACDAINKTYDNINLNDEFIKQYGGVKFKKLSAYNRAVLALKRAEIKSAKLMLFDVNLSGFSSEEISNYSAQINELIACENDRIFIIACNAEDYKKLQINNEKSEIYYIFAAKMHKFVNFKDFSNSADLMGMAEYLDLKKHNAKLVSSQNGYNVLFEEKMIKINDKYVKCVESYFDENVTQTDLVMFTNVCVENISDKKFNELMESGEILLYDRLSTERLK